MKPTQKHWLSPIGLICVESDGEAITRIYFRDGIAPNLPMAEESPIVDEAIQQLKSYFNGGSSFSLPLRFEGTAFQQKVWKALAEIPVGTTLSYQTLAEKLGDKKAVRAVGSATGLNPFLIAIPCHRLIGSDGKLTGYAGGLWRKKWLLNHENQIAGKPHQLSIF